MTHIEITLIVVLALSLLVGCGAGYYAWSARSRQPAPRGQNADDASLQIADGRAELARQATEILSAIRTQLAAGERLKSSLTRAGRDLPTAADPKKVHAVISFLLTENENMFRQTQSLQANLEKSHSEIEALRTNLSNAEELSLTDALTGVPNRRGYELALAKAIAEATRLGTPLSLAMCDLDHFKKLNDAHGHSVGDEVLKILTDILRENLRLGDTVARYGGEEFVIILTMTDIAEAVKTCERLREKIASRKLTLVADGQPIEKITASFGVTQYIAGESPGAFLDRADAKLYQAKNGGRNRVVGAQSNRR